MQVYKIRTINIRDYDKIIKLWDKTKGLGLTESDKKEYLETFLKKNPDLSFLTEIGKKIVGAVLCSHDGRRGYLYHVAVNEEYRRQGIGSKLISHCFEKLKQANISKCHLFVLNNNQLGKNFWEKIGFIKRKDISVFSKDII